MTHTPGKATPRAAVLVVAVVAALVTALLGALLLAAPASAQEPEALVRTAHLSPDTAAVDVRVDGEPVESFAGLSFETVTPYLRLPVGRHDVEIYAAGDASAPLFRADVVLQENTAYTVGVVGLAANGSLAPQVYEDSVSPPARGNTKLRVIHAVPDVGEVDVRPSGGTSLFTDLGFPNATTYAEVPAGTYTLEARPAGKEPIAFEVPDGTFSPESIYSAFVVGAATSGGVEVLVAEYAGDSEDEQGTAVLQIEPRPENIPLRNTAPIPDTGGPIPPLPLSLIAAGVAVFLSLSVAGLRGTRER